MAKISLRTIDYFKFKNLIIDRSTDDSDRCSREVQSLCDAVARLNSRTETFDPSTDRQRLDEVCGYYKLILENRKVIPMDVRLKSGWWGSDRNAYSAGKLKATALKETLVQKTKDWWSKNPVSNTNSTLQMTETEMEKGIEGPGVFVFKHRERRCFQLVGRTERIFSTVSDNLKASFEGAIAEPLAALLITSMALQWDFYFIPVTNDDGESIQCILENDMILKHDSIWPYGLNFRLNITSFVEVVQLRQSCRRHGWPPERKRVREGELYLNRLRLQVNEACSAFLALDTLNRSSSSSGRRNPKSLSINPDLPSSSLVSSTPSPLLRLDRRNADDDDRMSISSSASSGSSSSLGSSITATTVRTAIKKKPPLEVLDQLTICSEEVSPESQSVTPPLKLKQDRSSSVGASIRRTSASRSSSQLTATPRRGQAAGGTAVRSRSASHNGSQRSAPAAVTVPKRLSVEGQLNNGSSSGSISPLSLQSDSPRGSASSPGQAHHQSRLSWECPRSTKQGPKNKARDEDRQ